METRHTLFVASLVALVALGTWQARDVSAKGEAFMESEIVIGKFKDIKIKVSRSMCEVKIDKVSPDQVGSSLSSKVDVYAFTFTGEGNKTAEKAFEKGQTSAKGTKVALYLLPRLEGSPKMVSEKASVELAEGDEKGQYTAKVLMPKDESRGDVSRLVGQCLVKN